MSYEILLSALRMATPLIFAALAGYLSERAGVVNLALEGLMLAGAFGAATCASATGSSTVGILGALGASIALALIFATLTVRLKSDQVIAGIVINFLALGLTPVISKAVFGMSGGTPQLESTARLHSIWGMSPLVFSALLLIPIVEVMHRFTVFGQYLRFAGEKPEALRAQGVSPEHVKLLAILGSGFLCGLAGAYLSIDHGSAFTRNMTAGRGYIAIAALIIGRWKPLQTAAAAIAFGFVEASQILLQGVEWSPGKTVPVQWIQILPFIATLIVLASFAARRNNKT